MIRTCLDVDIDQNSQKRQKSKTESENFWNKFHVVGFSDSCYCDELTTFISTIEILGMLLVFLAKRFLTNFIISVASKKFIA